MVAASTFRRWRLRELAFALVFALAWTCAQAGQPLQDGVPILVETEDLVPDFDLFIEVPAGTTRIEVSLSGAGAFDDWDLFARFGSPFDLDGVPQTPLALVTAMENQADYFSAGVDADEHFTITAASSPPAQAGTWYIGVLRFDSALPTITLTVDLGDGPLEPLDILLINGDGPDEGFNDPTPTTTKGAATLGQARWNALEAAVTLLEERLFSPVPVVLEARFEDLGTDDDEENGVALASAGPTVVVGNTPGLEFIDTFYVGAVIARQAGTEVCHLAGGDCNEPDIVARFNENIDTDEAGGSSRFYYGLDPAQKPPNTFDFIDIALHEIIHGLGFVGFYDVETGEKPATTGGRTFDDIFGQRTEYFQNPEPDYVELDDEERVEANTSVNRLHFTGTNAVTSPRNIYAQTSDGHPQLHAPATVDPGSSVYHLHQGFGASEIMTPSVSVNAPVLRDPGIGLAFLKDLGWDDLGLGTGIDDIVLGMYYDRGRSGHGIDLQKVGEVYFLVFYTYEDGAKGVANAAPTWYLAVGTIEDGVFTTDGNNLQRFTYDAADDPPQTLDTAFQGDVSIRFGVSEDHPNCDDGTNRGTALTLAAFDWSIGADSGSWCMEPLVIYEGAPPVNPTGHWFAGSSDQGWGMTVYFQGTGGSKAGAVSAPSGRSDLGNPNAVTPTTPARGAAADAAKGAGDSLEFLVLYFYDSDGLPRWALGVKEPSALTNTINMDSFTGFAPADPPVPVATTPAGTISHSFLAAISAIMDIDVTHPGGGDWQRTAVPMQQLSDPAR